MKGMEPEPHICDPSGPPNTWEPRVPAGMVPAGLGFFSPFSHYRMGGGGPGSAQ